MSSSETTDKQGQDVGGNAMHSNIAWYGFDKKGLTEKWQKAVNTFLGPGGGAEQRLGSLSKVTIRSRDGNPVHKSEFNPKDTNDVISVRVQGARDTKTCHIYGEGKGTSKPGQRRR